MDDGEGGNRMTDYIEYDYNEFEATGMDIEEIKAKPESYITYRPLKPTMEEKLKELTERQDITEQAVQEMLLANMQGGE